MEKMGRSPDPSCKDCNGGGHVFIGCSGREDDGNAPETEPCDCWSYHGDPAADFELKQAEDAVRPRMWATEAEFFREGFRAAEKFHGIKGATGAP